MEEGNVNTNKRKLEDIEYDEKEVKKIKYDTTSDDDSEDEEQENSKLAEDSRDDSDNVCSSDDEDLEKLYNRKEEEEDNSDSEDEDEEDEMERNANFMRVKGRIDSPNESGHLNFRISNSREIKSVMVRKIDSFPSYNPFLVYDVSLVRNPESSVWSAYRIHNVEMYKRNSFRKVDIIDYLVSIKRVNLANEFKAFDNTNNENKDTVGIKFGKRENTVFDSKSALDSDEEYMDNEEHKQNIPLNELSGMDSSDYIGATLRRYKNNAPITENKKISSAQNKARKMKNQISSLMDKNSLNIDTKCQLYRKNLLKCFKHIKTNDIIYSVKDIIDYLPEEKETFIKSIKDILAPCFRCDEFYYLLRYFSAMFLYKVADHSKNKTMEKKRFNILKLIVINYPFVFSFWDRFLSLIQNPSFKDIFDVENQDRWLLDEKKDYFSKSERLLATKIFNPFTMNPNEIKFLPICVNKNDDINPNESCLLFDTYNPVWNLNILRSAYMDNYENSYRSYIEYKQKVDEGEEVDGTQPVVSQKWTFDFAKMIYISYSIYLKYLLKKYYEGSTSMSIANMKNYVIYYPVNSIQFLVDNDLLVWSEGHLYTYTLLREKIEQAKKEKKMDTINREHVKMIKFLDDHKIKGTKLSLSIDQKHDKDLVDILLNRIVKIQFFNCSFYDEKYCQHLLEYTNKYANSSNCLFVTYNDVNASYIHKNIGISIKSFQETIETNKRILNTNNQKEKILNVLKGLDAIVIDQAHKFSSKQLVNLLQYCTVPLNQKKEDEDDDDYTIYQTPTLKLFLFGDINDHSAHGDVGGGYLFRDLKLFPITNTINIERKDHVLYDLDYIIKTSGSIDSHPSMIENVSIEKMAEEQVEIEKNIFEKNKKKKKSSGVITSPPPTTSTRKKHSRAIVKCTNYLNTPKNGTHIHIFCDSIRLSYEISDKIHTKTNKKNISKVKFQRILRGFGPHKYFIGNWVYIFRENRFDVITNAWPYSNAGFVENFEVGKREDIQIHFDKYKIKIGDKTYLNSKNLNIMHADAKPTKLFSGTPANTVIMYVSDKTTRQDIYTAMRYCASKDFRLYVQPNVNIDNIMRTTLLNPETDLGYLLLKYRQK